MSLPYDSVKYDTSKVTAQIELPYKDKVSGYGAPINNDGSLAYQVRVTEQTYTDILTGNVYEWWGGVWHY